MNTSNPLFGIRLFGLLILAALAVPRSAPAQGSLTPPGAPAPTMKTLDQVEPRTPISSLPYEIDVPGSYYVTTNLEGSEGLIIFASDVSVDLNGFTLSGTNGSFEGVYLGGRTNVYIHDGSLRNWPTGGVDGGSSRYCHFENVSIYGCGSFGLNAGRACTIENCRVVECASGMQILEDSRVTSSLIRSNANIGINGGGSAVLIEKCIVRLNAGSGMFLGSRCQVKECLMEGNNGFGVQLSDACRVDGCLVISNTAGGIVAFGSGTEIGNCIARYNGSSGIVAGPRSRVWNSQSENNINDGFNLGDDSVIENCTAANQLSANANGISLGKLSSAVHCVAATNTHAGLSLSEGSQAQGCTASRNQIGFDVSDSGVVRDCLSHSNLNYGIMLHTGSKALNCTVIGTYASGLGITVTGSNAVVDGCQAINNSNFGIVVNTANFGNLIIRNSAKGNGVNYSIATNSMSGPIISFGSGAVVLTGVITNSNPWANFSY